MNSSEFYICGMDRFVLLRVLRKSVLPRITLDAMSMKSPVADSSNPIDCKVFISFFQFARNAPIKRSTAYASMFVLRSKSGF